MFLQKGNYDNRQFLESETVDLFTSCPFCSDGNRRGLGFDKPAINRQDPGPSSVYASDESFGHGGFTGTMAWADPENGLTYVFLSNRTFPTMSNTKLVDQNIRTRIHDLFYKALNPQLELNVLEAQD